MEGWMETCAVRRAGGPAASTRPTTRPPSPLTARNLRLIGLENIPANCWLRSHVHAQLHGTRPSERRAAEERALEQVLLVEHIVDVQLGPNDHTAEGKGVSDASVQNEIWIDVVQLVEIEQAGALRGIGAVVRNQARPVDAGCGSIEAVGRVHD